MDKKLIKENLQKLLELVKNHPEERLDLQQYTKGPIFGCGTIYCIAGLAASDPHFQKQGMNFGKDGRYLDTVFLKKRRLLCVDDRYRDILFGPSAISIFSSKGRSNYDNNLITCMGYSIHVAKLTNWDFISDKKLAIARIEHQLKLVEAA